MDEILSAKRAVYREQFNNICADFSIYRLKHNIDENFISMERQVWECREKAPHMTYEDIEQFESCLARAQAYLTQKEIFE